MGRDGRWGDPLLNLKLYLVSRRGLGAGYWVWCQILQRLRVWELDAQDTPEGHFVLFCFVLKHVQDCFLALKVSGIEWHNFILLNFQFLNKCGGIQATYYWMVPGPHKFQKYVQEFFRIGLHGSCQNHVRDHSNNFII